MPHLIALLAAAIDPATEPALLMDALLLADRPCSALAVREGCGEDSCETLAFTLPVAVAQPRPSACVVLKAAPRVTSCLSRVISGRHDAHVLSVSAQAEHAPAWWMQQGCPESRGEGGAGGGSGPAFESDAI